MTDHIDLHRLLGEADEWVNDRLSVPEVAVEAVLISQLADALRAELARPHPAMASIR